MKHKQYFKKSIISFLLVGAILVPYFGTAQNAYAQFNSGQQDLSYYMELATPMIPKLQGCKQVLKDGIGKGINAIKGLFSSSVGSGSTLTSAGETAGNMALSVSINNKIVDKATIKTEISTAGTKKTTDTVASNKLCLDSVGKMIAKMLIKTLTESTVNWINTGNFGESFWPKDRQTYFQDIAKNEILKFNSEISNTTLYPFGRAFMQNQALSLKNHFAQNAQYSLNKVIQDTTPEYTSLSFTTDFSAGGWNAWSALTQVPANNPIGFNLQASNELQARLEGTVQTAAQNVRDALKEAGGFLGQEQCASNHEITRQTEKQALVSEGNRNLVPGTSDYDKWNKDNICAKWEYVTPGGMIAQAATKLMDDKKDQLLSVTDLNDAIAAILDAAISKWGGELMNQGLASMSPSNPNDQFDYSGTSGIDGQTQVEQDFPLGSGNTFWLSENPDFNIHTDVTQALVDQQRTYVSKLEWYDKELDALNRTIYQLDYCMPGPHPGWESDSRESLQTTEDSILAEITDVEDFLTRSDTPSEYADDVISTVVQISFQRVTNMIFGFGADTSKITKEAGISFLDGTFNAYKTTIDKYYKDGNFMPFTWRESVEKFNKVIGYQQLIEDNKSEIIFQNENITKLQTLKKGIDNGTYTDFSPTSFVIKQFARISQNLKTGDDIANINGLYEQAKAERNYVWDNLLKGPSGCEQELQTTWRARTDWRFWVLTRPSYQEPHLYDYNMGVDIEIPDHPIPEIPGIQFSTISPDTNLPYSQTNKQAFTNQSLPSFLTGVFNVTAAYTNVVPDNFLCRGISVMTCRSGAYMDPPTFESKGIKIY